MILPERWKSLWLRHGEGLLYLFFGGLTTGVNYLSYVILSRLLPVGATLVPNSIAWVLSVLFAYWTNRTWVFKSKTQGSAQLLELLAFAGARIFSGLLDLTIVWLLVDRLGFSDLWVKLGSNVLVVVLNYLLSKSWIFKKDK